MCYIIFTSGSTGRPKGAVLQHAGVINYLHCLVECVLAAHAILSHSLLELEASKAGVHLLLAFLKCQ